nr:glycosyl hydrolase [Variovorax boronicumulans]
MFSVVKRLVASGLAAGLLFGAGGAAAQQSPPATATATAKPQIGVYLGGGCDGRKRLQAFENWLGRPVDFVVDFLAWDSWDAMAWAAGWVGRCWQEAGKRVVVSMPMFPRSKEYSLEAGARGDYDDKIRVVAQQLIRYGHGAATIRLGWEFNASWFAWYATKKPDQFVANWRRVVETMRSVPGAKFRFDWNPIVGPGMASPEPAYPGDDVVDVIGGDVYNNNYFPAGTPAEQRWQVLRDGPFGLRWLREFARKHGKPMSFPEWGTGQRPDGKGGGDDPVFMRGMIEWIAANPPEYHAYWDYNAKDYRSALSDGKQPLSAKEFLDAFGVAR